MSKIVKNVIDFIDGVCKEVIVFTGSAMATATFTMCLKAILEQYFKSNPICRVVANVIGSLSVPIFIKLMRKELGYSEQECKNIYDVLRDVCKLNEQKKIIENIETA